MRRLGAEILGRAAQRRVRSCAGILLVVAAAALLFPRAGLTQDASEAPAPSGVPCDWLRGEAQTRYNQLGDEALALYRDRDYLAAIQAMMDLRSICDEDPVIEYNMARAYEKADNCNMARYWYEQVLARDASRFGDLVAQHRADALTATTKLEQRCVDSALISVECSSSRVEVGVGAALKGSCPLMGRVDDGDVEVVGQRQGYEPYSVQVSLRAGELNRVMIPRLQRIREQMATGTLHLSCPEGRRQVSLKPLATGTAKDVDCPFSGEVDIGDYEVTARRMDNVHRFQVKPGEVTHVGFLMPKPVVEVVEKIAVKEPSAALKGTGWGFFTLGTVGVGVGLTLHLVADGKRDALVDDPTGHTPEEAQAIRDEADELDSGAFLTLGAGGGALLLGVVLLVIADLTADDVVVSTALSPDYAGLSASWTW